ncbi:Vanillin dehydrogenase [Lachnellula occidentalis]|uniref:Vanillin dehydrogenase n=1 Tax=Lachnellula occidentalis TaxID=215460 RepID=A0A8H8UFD5_9HELO|nr:Vanillin dehydrogenase [Lachnellula occidentalis]
MSTEEALSNGKPPKDKTTHYLLINNTAHPTPTSFPVHSPSTNTHLYDFSSADPTSTSHAITTAHAAFPAWKALPQPQKRDIFLSAASILTSRLPALCATMSSETGASASWAAFDTNLAIQILLDVSGRLSSLVGSMPQTSSPGTSALVYRDPYGVVLAIAPWNAPHILGMRSLIYPLAAGNTVIFKAHELCPLTHTALVTALHDAGLPPGVLTLLAHAPADAATVTRQLIEDPRVKKVNFTGSTGVGRLIAEMAAHVLKPCVLELGGKAPAIVWADADIELAARECAVGAFLNAGQICMSTERIIVHEDVMAEFEKAFVSAVKEMGFDGDKVLINRASVVKNQGLVADAVAKGARLVHGSSSTSIPDQEQNTSAPPSTSLSPHILLNPSPTSLIHTTESFGPTVSLYTTTSETSALSLANDTEYGLSAAIFTQDLRRGLRMAAGIESGAVHINGMTVHDETALPHGGMFLSFLPFFVFTLPLYHTPFLLLLLPPPQSSSMLIPPQTPNLTQPPPPGMKNSGYGRFGSAGLEEWVRTKTVTFKN